MNALPPQLRATTPLRTFLCVAGYSMMLMVGVLILSSWLSMAVNACQLYGWLLRSEPEYAPHWSAEQRKALAALEHAIRFDNECFADYSAMYRDVVAGSKDEPDSGSLQWALERDRHTMPHARLADDKLRSLVQLPAEKVGGAPALSELAFASAEMGQWDAMQVLVDKGLDVNAKNPGDDTLLSTVLSNMKSRPQAEVFAAAEWLLARGAEVKPCCALENAVSLADDECATLEWLLAHGLQPELWEFADSCFLPLDICAQGSVALPVFERLAKEGVLNVNDSRASATYLQRAALHVQPQAIALLLQLGADSALVSESPATTAEKLAPADILLLGLSESTDAEESSEALEALRLLLQHGAKPGKLLPELDASSWANAEVQQKVSELLREFGFSLPQTCSPDSLSS